MEADKALAPGTALAGPDAGWQLSGPGPIGDEWGSSIVIGGFVAHAPLEALNSSVLRRDDSVEVRRLLISVSDVSQLEPVASAVRSIVEARDPTALEVRYSDDLALLGDQVVEQLSSNARLMLGSLLTLVALLIGAVQFGRVTAMARDIGRRRALGASRSTVVAHILVMSGAAALVGAALGVLLGVAIVVAVTGQWPATQFTCGVAVLMLLASLAGAVPPALRAGFADPVRVLRVP